MAYVIAGIAGLVGALFLWDAWKAMALQAEWARGVIVEGEVIELMERRITQTGQVIEPGRSGLVATVLTVTPVVRYKTPEGEPGRLVSSLGFGRDSNPYALGDKVAVRYLAGGQPRAELDAALTHPSRFGSLLMGALFSAIALLIAFWDQVLGLLPYHS